MNPKKDSEAPEQAGEKGSGNPLYTTDGIAFCSVDLLSNGISHLSMSLGRQK